MVGHVKVVQSGNYLEIYEYENEVRKNLGQSRPKRSREGYKRSSYIRPDNVRRKAKEFKRLVRANLVGDQVPSLLTLTMYEDLGIVRSYKLLSVFFKRLRRYQGEDFRYIAVPEFQKRGAVHFHVIVWGLNYILKNESPKFSKELGEVERGSRYIQRMWQYGTCDSVLTDGSVKLAGYLAKYMSKSMFDSRLRGQKGYSASRNVLRSLSISFKSVLDNTKLIWDIDLEKDVPLHEREYVVNFLGKGRYRLFELNK